MFHGIALPGIRRGGFAVDANPDWLLFDSLAFLEIQYERNSTTAIVHQRSDQRRNPQPSLADLFRWSCLLMGCALAVTQLGCRSRGHRDAYHAKMANEIRVLEDQLYDADYQNQVLRDKLKRYQGESFETSIDEHYPPSDASLLPESPPLDAGQYDMGVGLGDPILDNDAFKPIETPAVPPQPEPEQQEAESESNVEELPLPPGGPEPPGASDVEVPKIVPGEILPPPADGDDIPSPPGKVDLPDNLDAKSDAPVPDQLQLHSGLSGGHQFDDSDEVDGLYLVVNVVDQAGRMIDLEQFQIDAQLSVVALDPNLEPDEARIARWEFEADELSRFIRSAPVSGLHVPVKWQGTRPSGDEVIVHVRLQTDDEEMRCQGRLKVTDRTTIADWTPRGEKAKR